MKSLSAQRVILCKICKERTIRPHNKSGLCCGCLSDYHRKIKIKGGQR